jgi:hypothetical protein
MRTELKTAFRPSLERFEARLVAAGGVASATAHHVAAHVAPHHPSHPPKHPAPHQTPTTAASTAQASAPSVSLPKNTTTDQAWVELVNMTGEPLNYQIKLGPYADGQFLSFDIGAGATQYQFSSLISNGQKVNADFAIQFGNGPVTPLMTGISESSAQGYYIFLDDNLQPYVAPFIKG